MWPSQKWQCLRELASDWGIIPQLNPPTLRPYQSWMMQLSKCSAFDVSLGSVNAKNAGILGATQLRMFAGFCDMSGVMQATAVGR